VETILTEMFVDTKGNHWLSDVMQFLQTRLQLSVDSSSFDSFKTGLLMFDRATLCQRIVARCHEVCYPPSTSKSHYYDLIKLSSAHNWVSFSSTANHFRWSRLFANNSFQFSRALPGDGSVKECPICHETWSVEHWFDCPSTKADRDLFTLQTQVPIPDPSVLPKIFSDTKLTIAFEFVLSHFFCNPT
jgi:hypothetical protein